MSQAETPKPKVNWADVLLGILFVIIAVCFTLEFLSLCMFLPYTFTGPTTGPASLWLCAAYSMGIRGFWACLILALPLLLAYRKTRRSSRKTKISVLVIYLLLLLFSAIQYMIPTFACLIHPPV